MHKQKSRFFPNRFHHVYIFFVFIHLYSNERYKFAFVRFLAPTWSNGMYILFFFHFYSNEYTFLFVRFSVTCCPYKWLEHQLQTNHFHSSHRTNKMGSSSSTLNEGNDIPKNTFFLFQRYQITLTLWLETYHWSNLRISYSFFSLTQSKH